MFATTKTVLLHGGYLTQHVLLLSRSQLLVPPPHQPVELSFGTLIDIVAFVRPREVEEKKLCQLFCSLVVRMIDVISLVNCNSSGDGNWQDSGVVFCT